MLEGVTKIGDLKKSLEFVLKWEGGYSNDPSDPGGETKWGISKKAHPNEDIKNLTKERALEIYAQDYWLAAGCDSLNYPENLVVFDSAVQHGVSRATGWLRCCNSVENYLDLRATYYVDIIKKDPTLAKYQRGWFNRLGDLKKLVIISQGGEEPPPREPIKQSWWAKYL